MLFFIHVLTITAAFIAVESNMTIHRRFAFAFFGLLFSSYFFLLHLIWEGIFLLGVLGIFVPTTIVFIEKKHSLKEMKTRGLREKTGMLMALLLVLLGGLAYFFEFPDIFLILSLFFLGADAVSKSVVLRFSKGVKLVECGVMWIFVWRGEMAVMHGFLFWMGISAVIISLWETRRGDFKDGS